MPLLITIELISPHGTKRELARAVVERVSDIGEAEDYDVTAREGDNHVAGAGMWSADGEIIGHDRRQSVWELVGKVANWAAEQALRRNRPKPDAEHRVRVENVPGYDTSDDVAAVRQMADDAIAGVDEHEVKAEAARFAALFGRK